jgi:hypothetical protein
LYPNNDTINISQLLLAITPIIAKDRYDHDTSLSLTMNFAMVHITVAGLPSDPELAQVSLINKAEMLSYHLERNLPDFSVTITYCKPEDWESFVSEQYRIHGWKVRLSRDRTIKDPAKLTQLIFYTSGELVGNTRDYVEHIKQAYNVQDKMDNELLKNIARENTESFYQSLSCQ